MLARLTGTADVSGGKVTITSEEREEREYTVPASARLKVEDGQPVQAGDLLTEGSKDPEEVLRIQGRDAVQRYLDRRGPGGLSVTGREHQRQAHRGHRTSDAAQAARRSDG